MKITELLIRQSKNDSVAIKQGNRKLTYQEWNRLAEELKDKINAELADSCQCIGIFLPNSIEYAIGYFGVIFSDRVVVPIGIQAKEPEIQSTITYCEIDMLITCSKYENFLIEVLANCEYHIVLFNIETGRVTKLHSENDFIEKTDSLFYEGNDDDVAIMLHTSGTTDNPKRVMLTHKNLIENVKSNINSLELTEKDKGLIALPMFFGYCNTTQFLTHLYLGASIVILDGIFMPKYFFQLVEKEKITNFTAVPSMLLMILEYRYAHRYDFSDLRYICFGGGKMPVNRLKELLKKYTSIGFVQTYGQTECSPRVTALMPQYALSKVGSVGTAIPGVQMRVNMDFTGSAQYDNGQCIGEIEVSGNNIMKGYYKRYDETLITRNGEWHRTGDLGYFDKDGFLYLTGRLKNIIISGGINIYPEEVEKVILQNDVVYEVCVSGKEDVFLGEVPVANIVVKTADVDIDKLKKFCQSKLADYKVPVEFRIVDELKKTYNGKLKRGD